MITVLIGDVRADALAARLRLPEREVCIRTAKDPQQLAQRIGEADALATFGFPPWFDAGLMARAPRLRWVQALTTGTDQLVRLLKPEVLLTSATGIHGPPVSEMTMLLMLALARRFPAYQRQQEARQWLTPLQDPVPRGLLYRKTVGIAGMGVIGRAIAQRCRAFGMSIVGFGSMLRVCDDVDRFHTYAKLPEHAGSLDFLVIVTQLDPATEKMFDAKIFDAMKPTSFVVNVGRGGTVNEADLLAALRDKRIAGAALDTVEQEPLPPNSPFWTCPNVLITPHAAGYYDEYMTDVAGVVEDNIRLFAAGRFDEMRNLVRRS